VLSPLVGCRARLGLAQSLDVELGRSVEAVQAVALLEGVGQLGVAVPEHLWVVEEHADQAGEALVELLLVCGTSPIAPRPPVVVAGSRSCRVRSHQVPPNSLQK
jgi:hypothetical protein